MHREGGAATPGEPRVSGDADQVRRLRRPPEAGDVIAQPLRDLPERRQQPRQALSTVGNRGHRWPLVISSLTRSARGVAFAAVMTRQPAATPTATMQATVMASSQPLRR